MYDFSGYIPGLTPPPDEELRGYAEFLAERNMAGVTVEDYLDILRSIYVNDVWPPWEQRFFPLVWGRATGR